jgi:hypothetical protein
LYDVAAHVVRCCSTWCTMLQPRGPRAADTRGFGGRGLPHAPPRGQGGCRRTRFLLRALLQLRRSSRRWRAALAATCPCCSRCRTLAARASPYSGKPPCRAPSRCGRYSAYSIYWAARLGDLVLPGLLLVYLLRYDYQARLPWYAPARLRPTPRLMRAEHALRTRFGARAAAARVSARGSPNAVSRIQSPCVAWKARRARVRAAGIADSSRPCF